MDSCHKVKLVLRTTSGNQFQQLKLRDLFKAPNITGSMKSKDYLKFSLDVLVGQVIKTFRQKEWRLAILRPEHNGSTWAM